MVILTICSWMVQIFGKCSCDNWLLSKSQLTIITTTFNCKNNKGITFFFIFYTLDACSTHPKRILKRDFGTHISNPFSSNSLEMLFLFSSLSSPLLSSPLGNSTFHLSITIFLQCHALVLDNKTCGQMEPVRVVNVRIGTRFSNTTSNMHRMILNIVVFELCFKAEFLALLSSNWLESDRIVGPIGYIWSFILIIWHCSFSKPDV